MWKAYFNSIIRASWQRPLPRSTPGHDGHQHLGLVCTKSGYISQNSTMEPANRLLWVWYQRVAGGRAREKGTRTLSQRLFSWAPAKKQLLAPKEALTHSAWGEIARWLLPPGLPFPSSWPSLLARAGRASHLPISSLVTATLEMAGRAQE